MSIWFPCQIWGIGGTTPTFREVLVPSTSTVLGTLYQELGTRYLVQSTWYQVLGTKYLVPSMVPNTWYQVFGTKYLVPSTWYQALGTKYFVPSTWYQVPGTKYQVRYLYLVPKLLEKLEWCPRNPRFDKGTK